MPFRPMALPGAFIFTPEVHRDNRGEFQESFRLSMLKSELGIDFEVKQVNQSTSAKGVIRGIHYTRAPFSQMKYVSCSKGQVWDVVVDLRPESETFGGWDAIVLSPENGRSVIIPEGFGHAFLSLEDDSVVSYLCSREFDKERDGAFHPFSEELGIDFVNFAKDYGIKGFILSEKDAQSGEFRRLSVNRSN